MKFLKYIKYIYLVIYIVLIIIAFSKSSASAEESSQESDTVTDIVVGTVDTITPSEESIVDIYGIDKIKEFVRKGIGHFGLFVLIGFFGFLTFYNFFLRKKIAVLLNLVAGLLIASISEIIQIFADSRGPAFKDVLLDFSGYLLSTLIILGVVLIIKLTKKNKNKVVSE